MESGDGGFECGWQYAVEAYLRVEHVEMECIRRRVLVGRLRQEQEGLPTVYQRRLDVLDHLRIGRRRN
jgi:hypothetical protein